MKAELIKEKYNIDDNIYLELEEAVIFDWVKFLKKKFILCELIKDENGEINNEKTKEVFLKELESINVTNDDNSKYCIL